MDNFKQLKAKRLANEVCVKSVLKRCLRNWSKLFSV